MYIRKIFIRNQKELKLTKNPHVACLDKNLRKFIAIFYNIISFFLEKNYKVMLHLLHFGKYLKSKEFGENRIIN